MPKATASKPMRASATAKAEPTRPAITRESSRVKTTRESTAKMSTRDARPYDRPLKTVKREGSRPKASSSSTKIAEDSYKKPVPAARASAKPPRVISRTFIGENIVLLHRECNYNSETIYLQYRDGTPLPRPNVVGFELIDRLIRAPVGWTGFGTPYLYQASIMKRGSYALKYKGREVWSYGQDDLAEMEKEYEETKETPEDLERWDRFMAFYTEKVKTIRVVQEDRVLAQFGNDVIAYDDPDEDFYPEEFFVRMDSELTHEWREYKKRTGKAMQYGPMPVVRT